MYKPKILFQLDAPKYGSRSEAVVLYPRVTEATWTKNHHLIADELKVTIGWKEGGVDPRMLKNARCAFWLWDENKEDFDQEKHLRFTGICKRPSRRLTSTGWGVDLVFYDYTTLFLMNKPLATGGMPEWSDTLTAIWERICDNTGWLDPATGQIVSSVAALRDNLVFERPDFAERTLGEMVNARFHAISKPQPKIGASSWDVWQWCVASLGLMSYIDKDRCIITDAPTHFDTTTAACAVYGENIYDLEEDADTQIASKGILLKSFDPLNGRALEAFYPVPGDERLHVRRAAARPKSEAGTTVTANEQSADYEEFDRYDITDQAALDRAAREGYEERSRQELHGSFKTAEMYLETKLGEQIDIFSMNPGDAVCVLMDPDLNRDTLRSLPSEEARVRYLVDNCDYDEDVARLIARNIDYGELADPTFHSEGFTLDIGPDKFEVEMKFHNIIFTNT